MEFTPWIRLSLRSFCRRLFWVKIEKLILLQLSDGIKWFPTTFGPFWRGTSPRSRIIVQHPDFPKNTNLYFSAAAGRCSYVCWFRHCWRNHFYLFTPSGSHDEAAFCPQWGFWVDAVLAKTFREREIFSGNCGFFKHPQNQEVAEFPERIKGKRAFLEVFLLWLPQNMMFEYSCVTLFLVKRKSF